MACLSCQERRKAIAAFASKVGTVVFGGKKRVLADRKINAASAELVKIAVEETRRGQP